MCFCAYYFILFWISPVKYASFTIIVTTQNNTSNFKSKHIILASENIEFQHQCDVVRMVITIFGFLFLYCVS